MDQQLQQILSSVNQWLTFAEAKNLGLVALNGAAVFSATGILIGQQRPPQWVCLYLGTFIVFAAIGLAFSLFSLLPTTNLGITARGKKPCSPTNLLFYGHLATYAPEELVEELRMRMGLCNQQILPIHLEYAQQIIVNSRIALHKYRCFKISALMVLAGVVTPLGAIPAWLWSQRKPR
jgi:hypothetical protein